MIILYRNKIVAIEKMVTKMPTLALKIDALFVLVVVFEGAAIEVVAVLGAVVVPELALTSPGQSSDETLTLV